jgi:hypothetical protein
MLHQLIVSIFFLVGFLLVMLPIKWLLRFDKGKGYKIYQQTLESTQNEKKALEAVGKFYKLFGMGFILLSLCFIYFGNSNPA